MKLTNSGLEIFWFSQFTIQQIFTCPKSIIETLEKDEKYVQN